MDYFVWNWCDALVLITYALIFFWSQTYKQSCVFVFQRIPLSEMTRTEINKLMATLGFYKKENPEDQVPEESASLQQKTVPLKANPPAPAP